MGPQGCCSRSAPPKQVTGMWEVPWGPCFWLPNPWQRCRQQAGSTLCPTSCSLGAAKVLWEVLAAARPRW